MKICDFAILLVMISSLLEIRDREQRAESLFSAEERRKHAHIIEEKVCLPFDNSQILAKIFPNKRRN